MRPRFSRWEWFAILVSIALLIVILTGCAVPVRNENNDKPLLTAPTGVVVPDGKGGALLNPGLPQPAPGEYIHTTPFDWTQLIGLATALLGGGGIAHALAVRGRLSRAEASEDQGWDHALNLAKQVPPK